MLPLGLNLNALSGKVLHQFAGLEHLADDVTTADELALDIKLGDRRPLGKLLDALTDFRIDQDIDALEAHAQMGEHLDHRSGKSALRKDRAALHEQNHLAIGDFTTYPLIDRAFDGG
eukprot:TRINITY_DN18909_c0_g1_i3.p4 TRINITY_DN18909_c0_g1~~TRINITY_DN18909_c0_g1_i3.p4  ORF type:complete len:117 (+),score=6.80 TRINITY_DN18909_c0_g1_i3:350-700(+)